MASLLDRPGVLPALYTGNALWFSSAFFHFAFRSKATMSRVSLRKHASDAGIRALPFGDAWHHDILKYLGGMNSSLALLAALRLYALVRPSRGLLSTGATRTDTPLDIVALTVLGLANCSQAVLNFGHSGPNDRWIMGKGLDRITVLDAVFTVLDWAAVAVKVVSGA